MLRRFGLTLLALLGFVSPAAAQMQMAVANACPPATLTAVADGQWSSAGTWSGNRVPTAADSVKIGGGHTVTGSGDVGCVTVGSATDANDAGTWNFAGTFTFTTIQVERYGDFSTTQPFEGIIRDSPIDTTLDPEQNGHGIIIDSGRAYWIAPTRTTWVEHTDIRAGDTVLHLRQPPVNWQPGEKAIVFDTRRGNNCANGGCTQGAQREVKIIASVSGSDVTVTTPFQYDHTSVGSPYPSADGTVKRFYPWATHIGGQSIFRSQNPAGVRGHFIAVAHADVWLENITFDEMGRTKMGATTTGGGANQIGRYPVHMHHNVGRAPQSNGRAFTLHGLEVNGSPRYCAVIHKSSWGLIEDNAVYSCPAAGFYYEDGDEYENITQRNSSVFGIGQGGREDITAGFGFYYRGPWNHTLNNRSANHFNSQGTEAAYGFKYFPKYLGTVLVSPAPGQMPSLSRNSYTQGAITQFEGNYCFADDSCFTFWWINLMPGYQEGLARSTIKDLTFVRIPEKGVFQYEGVRMTFDGLIGRDFYRGWAGQDYIFKYGEVRNVDFQTCDTGMEISPITSNTELLVENSQFACTSRNLAPMLNWTSGNPAYIGVNAQTIRRFRNIKTLVGKAYTLILANGQRNYSSTQVTYVEAHQGNPSDNFQWFAPGSAPSDILPQHAPVGCTPGTTCSRVGSPAAGLTNSQNLAQYKLWFMGPPLCANPLTSSNFDGYACGTVTPPPPTCTYSVAPTATHQSPDTGDTFPLTITASQATGCPAWTATSSQPWATLAPTGGTATSTAPTTITATVVQNTTTAIRTATLTIDGQTIAVQQAAAASTPCTFQLAPPSASVGAVAGSTPVTVTSSGTPPCTWASTSGAAWLSVSPTSGTGNASVAYQANAGASRSGTVTIGGQAFTVMQAGVTPPVSTITMTTRDSRYAAVRPTCSAGCVRAEFTRTMTVAGTVTTFTDTILDSTGEYVWLFTEPVDASGAPLGYSLFAVVFDAQGGSQRKDLVGR